MRDEAWHRLPGKLKIGDIQRNRSACPIAQALGRQAILHGFVVLYRSIFDVTRDFLSDEVLGGDDKSLAKYLRLNALENFFRGHGPSAASAELVL